MHRIPRIFVPRQSRKDMDSKQKSGPKLERRLAKKNIDYEPGSSSSSSSLSAVSEETSGHRTRSLDLAPFRDTTSFRVQGIDGEVDLIYQNLGLSPEDFELPTAEWEARKFRSSSDVLPRRVRLQEQLDSPQQVGTAPPQLDNGGGANEMADGFAEIVGISDAALGQRESVQLNDDRAGTDRLIESDRVCDFNENQNYSPESVGYPIIAVEPSRGGRGGIRGVRPPVLAPPPSISLPVIDNTCSPWDIIRSFAPDSDRVSSSVRGFVSSDHDEGTVQREEVIGVRLGETAVLSGSCSFTTSNDDDSSSTTTEPTSNISPNYRFRSIITGWQKGKLLGRGSFGSVYEGITDDGFFFAVKEVSLLDQGDMGRQSICQLEQEIALLSQFEHENIVQYYGTAKDESNLYIFLELVTQGSLLNLYQKYHLRDFTVSSYTRQILHGLNYLHEREVVHRDIKCANILVGANGSVKLSDFGLAKATKSNDVKSCKGTAFWMAPEVVNLKNQGYGLPADIWSLGCTVLEMSTRQLPYYPLECMQALFRIGRGLPPPLPDSLSGDARDFILKCLEVKPSARPTAAQLLEHPFVRRPLPTSLGSSSPYNYGQQIEGFPTV